MDPTTQLLGSIGQILFYGGLLACMFGLPAFIWLAVRACRDLHRISESLHWIAHCTRAPEQPAQAPRPHVTMSQFGR